MSWRNSEARLARAAQTAIAEEAYVNVAGTDNPDNERWLTAIYVAEGGRRALARHVLNMLAEADDGLGRRLRYFIKGNIDSRTGNFAELVIDGKRWEVGLDEYNQVRPLSASNQTGAWLLVQGENNVGPARIAVGAWGIDDYESPNGQHQPLSLDAEDWSDDPRLYSADERSPRHRRE